MDNFGNISLPDLIRFQEDVLDLSLALNNAHEKIEEGLMVASNYWQDTKFDEFFSSFKGYSEELENISYTYRRWAETHLQDTINVLYKRQGIDPGK
jgi:hypothetical protein